MRKLSCSLLFIAFIFCNYAPVFGQAPAAGPPPAPQPSPTAPLYQAKGEQYRIYNFPGTGESIPYRLFVPSRWTPATKLPMLVTLRAGNTVDGPYRANNDLVKEGEKRGYLVVTPMGYRGISQPYYGSPYPVVRPTGPPVPAAGWTAEANQRSEQDVMYVIDLVRRSTQSTSLACLSTAQNRLAQARSISQYPEKFPEPRHQFRPSSSTRIHRTASKESRCW